MHGVPWEAVYSTSFVPRDFNPMRRLNHFSAHQLNFN